MRVPRYLCEWVHREQRCQLQGPGKVLASRVCVCACHGLHQQLELDYHLKCCMSWCQQLGRLGSSTSQWAFHVSEHRCWRDLTCTYVYILLPGGPPSYSVMYVCCVYECLLGTHTHTKPVFRLAIGWTSGHWAAAALPLLGCLIWHDMFSSNKRHCIANTCQMSCKVKLHNLTPAIIYCCS